MPRRSTRWLPALLGHEPPGSIATALGMGKATEPQQLSLRRRAPIFGDSGSNGARPSRQRGAADALVDVLPPAPPWGERRMRGWKGRKGRESLGPGSAWGPVSPNRPAATAAPLAALPQDVTDRPCVWESSSPRHKHTHA